MIRTFLVSCRDGWLLFIITPAGAMVGRYATDELDHANEMIRLVRSIQQ